MAPEIDYLRWSVPFYLDFLHGNFISQKEIYSVASPHRRSWEEWRDLLRREMKNVTPEIVGDLMMDRDWRPQICGAYFCGLNRWDDFTLDIGRRLVAKKNGYATQGYTFALARMPSHAAANYLCGYLSRVGHYTDASGWYGYDVEWVVAALQWVDAQMGTHRVEPYVERLVPLWQERRYRNLLRWYRDSLSAIMESNAPRVSLVEEELARDEAELSTYFLPDDGERQSEWFWKLMDFCETNFD